MQRPPDKRKLDEHTWQIAMLIEQSAQKFTEQGWQSSVT